MALNTNGSTPIIISVMGVLIAIAAAIGPWLGGAYSQGREMGLLVQKVDGIASFIYNHEQTPWHSATGIEIAKLDAWKTSMIQDGRLENDREKRARIKDVIAPLELRVVELELKCGEMWRHQNGEDRRNGR